MILVLFGFVFVLFVFVLFVLVSLLSPFVDSPDELLPLSQEHKKSPKQIISKILTKPFNFFIKFLSLRVILYHYITI